MKRTIAALLMAVTLVGLLSATALGARRPTTFEARAHDADPGRMMRIVAVVKRPNRTLPFSAHAVVRLASGDVSIDLEPRGGRYRAVGRVRIPRSEVPGPVVVHVTIVYGDLQRILEIEARVLGDEPTVPPTDPPIDPDPPTEN